MMGRSPGCYITIFVKISQPVSEKIFETVLPYMGLTAILVKLPRCRDQTVVPPTHGYNLALIGLAVSEKMFEHCERRKDDGWMIDDGRRRMGIL